MHGDKQVSTPLV